MVWCLRMVQQYMSKIRRSAFVYFWAKKLLKFSLGRFKVSYVITYDLASYFSDLVKEKLKSCGPSVVCFGESQHSRKTRADLPSFALF